MEKQSRDFCRVQKKKKEGVTMKRKRGLVHVILALLMSMLPVSYTHLDVYKRQIPYSLRNALEKPELVSKPLSNPACVILIPDKISFFAFSKRRRRMYFPGDISQQILKMWQK